MIIQNRISGKKTSSEIHSNILKRKEYALKRIRWLFKSSLLSVPKKP
jgi:hypothetical protein